MRLRSRPKQHEKALHALLEEAGAFARCRATHTSRAGFCERGSARPLDHPAVSAAAEHFDLIVRADRLREVTDAKQE